jgi:heterodisulfide reductase subunit A-like polyferredoxin
LTRWPATPLPEQPDPVALQTLPTKQNGVKMGAADTLKTKMEKANKTKNKERNFLNILFYNIHYFVIISQMKIAILGGGIAGLTAAYYLAKKNHQITLFEKEKIFGGLAAGFKSTSWDWYLEWTYHHLFANDL